MTQDNRLQIVMVFAKICAVTDDVEQNRDASASCICEQMEEAINHPLQTFMRPRY